MGIRDSPVVDLLVQHLDDEGVVERFVADRRLGTVAGLDAVSYTPLDVYKRQAL